MYLAARVTYGVDIAQQQQPARFIPLFIEHTGAGAMGSPTKFHTFICETSPTFGRVLTRTLNKQKQNTNNGIYGTHFYSKAGDI